MPFPCVLCACRCCARLAKVVAWQLQEWSAGVSRGAQGVPHSGLLRRMRKRLLLAGTHCADTTLGGPGAGGGRWFGTGLLWRVRKPQILLAGRAVLQMKAGHT